MTEQELEPEQAPDQPAKVEPLVAEAVRATDVPLLKEYPQVEPQLMPEGLLATAPCPEPALATDRT